MSDLMYPNQPHPGQWVYPPNRIDDLLRWAHAQGVSDVKITPTDPIAVRQQGVWKHCTTLAPSVQEIFRLVEIMSRDPGVSAQVLRGLHVNFSYQVTLEPGRRDSGMIRFRGSATACSDGINQGMGATITLRLIPGHIPGFDDLSVPEELRRILFPDNGLVILSGVMGSGKTTLLAACIHHVRTHQDRSILTLEKPIEFDYTNIPGARGTVEQIEIPRMMESFAEGVVSCTRKATDMLLVGEANDPETMEAAIHASEVGIAVYATLHTSSVAAIIPRIIHQFPQDEQAGIAISLMSALRVGIQQRLVPKKGGGRTALREWVELTEDHRNWLIEQDIHDIYGAMDKIVQQDGHPLLLDAEIAYEQGRIDEAVYHRIKAEKQTGKKSFRQS